jgi:hypothetical protein
MSHQSKPTNKKQMAFVKRVMTLTGVGFASMGALIIITPGIAVNFLDLDISTARILGASLIFVGVMDILIVPRMLDRKEKS